MDNSQWTLFPMKSTEPTRRAMSAETRCHLGTDFSVSPGDLELFCITLNNYFLIIVISKQETEENILYRSNEMTVRALKSALREMRV